MSTHSARWLLQNLYGGGETKWISRKWLWSGYLGNGHVRGGSRGLWLDGLDHNDGNHPLHQTRIQHAGNAGEFKIPESRYFVDGYDPATNTVYEFHGCFWHGCRICFPNRHEPHERHLYRNMQDMRQLTERKMQFLRDKGCQVKECWECEWRQQKASNPAIMDYVNTLDFWRNLWTRGTRFRVVEPTQLDFITNWNLGKRFATLTILHYIHSSTRDPGTRKDTHHS